MVIKMTYLFMCPTCLLVSQLLFTFCPVKKITLYICIMYHAAVCLSSQSHNWPDSEGLCETWGTLANIFSNETNTSLSNLLHNAGHSAAWIGLTNIGHADWYEWTATHEEPVYSAWSAGAPTNVSCSGVMLGAGWTLERPVDV